MLPGFDCIVLCVVLWFKCTYVCYLVGLDRVRTVTVESYLKKFKIKYEFPTYLICYLGNLSNRVKLWLSGVLCLKSDDSHETQITVSTR